MRRLLTLMFALAAVAPAAAAGAQPLLSPTNGAIADAAPVPVAPEVESRDAEGRVTVRATRIATPLVIDGRLDEQPYRDVRSMSNFLQTEPQEGAPTTERTEVWVFFDDEAIYVSARCWQDPSVQLVANDMRRDGQNIFRNDNFAVIFDTFRDRRNGLLFQTTPLGAVSEQQSTDEGASFNRDWNTVWDLRVTREAQAWYVEMAIPFKSLRFPAGQEQVWGINFRRVIQGKSEYTYFTQLPRSAGPRALARVSKAATLVGLEIGRKPRQLEIKPYGISTLNTDREAAPPTANDFSAKGGLDLKAGIGPLTADFTLFTDFAQVEEDEAQVNLTRFSLFNPEKREFFLEGQGIFAFGGVPLGRQPGGGGPPVAPIIFFSRKVGVADDSPVDIIAGGRVTGRVGAWTVGALQIRQDAGGIETPLPTTDFTAVRVRRDILSRSSIGLIYTRRSPNDLGADVNQVGGIDGYFPLSQDLTINAYVAASTKGQGSRADALSYRGRLEYTADRYGLQLEHLVVGDDFSPQAGLLRREDFQRSFVEGRVSRRPKSTWLRRWSLQGNIDYITNNDRELESHVDQANMQLEMTNGDEFELQGERSREVIDEAFDLTDTEMIGVGDYRFGNVRASYRLGPRHRVTGEIGSSAGTFYGGTIREAFYRGRVELTRFVSLEPNLSFNWIELPDRDPFTINVAGVRTTWTITPRAVASALLQYSSGSGDFGGSARLRWEYRPGSEIFVVYSEGRDTALRGTPLLNRTFAVKMTRLLRF